MSVVVVTEYVSAFFLGCLFGVFAFIYMRLVIKAFVKRTTTGLIACSLAWVISFLTDTVLRRLIMEPVLNGEITGAFEGIARCHSWIIVPFIGTSLTLLFSLRFGASRL